MWILAPIPRKFEKYRESQANNWKIKKKKINQEKLRQTKEIQETPRASSVKILHRGKPGKSTESV